MPPRHQRAVPDHERVWSRAHSGYFAGETLTLADLLLAPQLDFLQLTPEWQTLTAAHSNLGSWLGRMRSRPSMIATTWERVAAMASAA